MRLDQVQYLLLGAIALYAGLVGNARIDGVVSTPKIRTGYKLAKPLT